MGELSDPAEAFINWVERSGRGPSTVRSYRSDLKMFEIWLHDNGYDPRKPSLEDARRYVDDRLGTTLMNSTVERTAVTLRQYFSFNGEHDVRRVLRRVTQPESYTRCAPVADVLKQLDKLPKSSPSEKRNKAMLEVMYSCALRVRDVMALSLDDVEVNAIVVDGKHRPLGAPAKKAINDWLGTNGRTLLAIQRGVTNDPTRLFVSNAGQALTRQGVNYICTQTSGFMPYVYRDSCAQHMIDRGAPIDAVRNLLGSTVASGPYAEDFNAMRRVHKQFHPRS